MENTTFQQKLIFLIFTINFIHVTTGFAQQRHERFEALQISSLFDRIEFANLNGYELFDLDFQAIHAYAKQQQGRFRLELQLEESQHWEMTLFPNPVHESDFYFQSDKGERIAVEKNITYRGHLTDKPAVQVRMTIAKGYISGVVYDEQIYAFETKPHPTKSENVLVYYSANQMEAITEFCSQNAIKSAIYPNDFGTPPAHKNNATYCPKLSVVLDWQGLNVAGSEAQFNNDLQTIVNIVNGYFEQFGVEYTLNPVYFITASPNPWADTPGNAAQLTQNFANWAYPNLMPNDYNCALLFTGTDMNGIGYAFYGHMCTDDNARYGEIDYLYDQPITQRANITTHELGHLWGALHVSQSSQHIMSPSIYDGDLQWTSTSQNTISTAVNSTFNACLPACFVGNPPEVSWLTPADRSFFTSLDSITLSAQASDSDGSITQVEFFVNGISIGIDNSSPYTLNWSPTTFGSYELTAMATDNDGNNSSSTIIIVVQDGAQGQISVQINASDDDAEETVSGGGIDLSSSDLELVEDGSTQEVGMRFSEINIPSGATIVDAYVQFTVDETSSSATNLSIYGQLHANAPTFSTSSYDISTRIKTASVINWSPAAWSTPNEAGLAQQTPDLTTIVQEVINQPGWAAGNALALIITGSGRRTAESYNGSAANAPILFVEYLLSGTPEVSWSQPTDEQVFTNLNAIDFHVHADDSDGSVAQVEFFVDDTSIGTDNTTPYEVIWSPPGFAEYTLKAVATDNEGNTNFTEISIIVQDGITGEVVSQINSSNDDAEERISDGYVNLSSSDLELVDEYGTTPQEVGLRFTNIDIPAEATITSAYVQFTVDELHSGNTSLSIQGQYHENAPAFSSTTHDISNRVKTMATTSWFPPSWSSGGAAGLDQQTPDLSAVIQEIIDHPNWVANNAIALIITGMGQRTASSYDGSTSEAPTLHVTYQYQEPSLPIQFVQFYGQQKDNAVALEWQLHGESNADYLVLERTGDGKDVELLTKIPYNSEQTSYQFLDTNPLSAVNYYRLSESGEGELLLLGTTAVTFEPNKDWLFFPNPARTVINIQSPVAIEVITLIDVKGTVVLERIFKSVDVLAHSNLDLKNVPAGLYFLKVQTANGLEVERIVVGK